MGSRQKTPVTRDRAENTAILAIGYLAQNEPLLQRFLALSGLDAAALRSLADTPDFMRGVLEFLMAHEEDLIAFSSGVGLDPSDVGRACTALVEPPDGA